MEEQLEIVNNTEQRRWQVEIDGRLALLQYQERDGQVIYLHTEVPPELEGRGIAGAMARAALDDARARGLRVVPFCPFVASYIRRHPEYQDLVETSAKKPK
jgi:predicted GNAT family acetyltransferase